VSLYKKRQASMVTAFKTNWLSSSLRNLPNTYDCGTQPIANPTTPLSNRIQRKFGANELRNA